MIRDGILFPAIGSAIPYCMSQDLYASVHTTMVAGRRNRTEEASHIVGVHPMFVPPGMRLYRPERRK